MDYVLTGYVKPHVYELYKQDILVLSNEDLGSTEGIRILHNIVDLAIRTFNNITTTLFKLFKDFKRSELQFYKDSHTTALSNLFNKQYINYDQLIDIPGGMHCTYRHAIDTIFELLTTLDIDTKIKALAEFVITLDSGNIDAKAIQDFIKGLVPLDKKVLTQKLNTVFSNNKTYKVPLNTVITSFDDVAYVFDKVLTLAEVYSKVKANINAITEIEKQFDTVVTTIEQNGIPNSEFVSALHDLLFTVAEQLDAYGVLLAESQRIEHNWVHVIQDLVNSSFSTDK